MALPGSGQGLGAPRAPDEQHWADHTGLLIIRAWVEPGSPQPLRAHIRIATDVSAGIERTLTLTQPDEVGAIVQEWLAAMLTPPSDPVTT